MSWHVVDSQGRDPATGRLPRPPGRPSAVAALAAVPVAPWPLGLLSDDGRRLRVAEALGPGGERVGALIDALAAAPGPPDRVGPLAPRAFEALARATPGGPVRLPLAITALPEGVEAAAAVDAAWLATVDRRRGAVHRALLAGGRSAETEAALHVAILVATERFDPTDDADVDAHVASGARLWLLTGAVTSALADASPDPFEGWARLVTAGWWPVGPSAGRLVVSRPGPCAPSVGTAAAGLAP